MQKGMVLTFVTTMTLCHSDAMLYISARKALVIRPSRFGNATGGHSVSVGGGVQGAGNVSCCLGGLRLPALA